MPYKWTQLGKPSMYSNARKKVDEILAAPMSAPLSDAATQQLTDVTQFSRSETFMLP
jgi:trimethylamine:corrinoid methyltransferase-like protein